MEQIEKAKIRIGNWIHHNDHHAEEYQLFAEQLAESGQIEASQYLEKMILKTSESTELLKKALGSLKG